MTGCGGFARYHLRVLADIPDCRVTALCDIVPSQMELSVQAQPGLKGVAQYSSHSEMLERAELDAVLICTPHTLHAEQAVSAFRRGLHVLVEKPLATSVTDCLTVTAARDESKNIGAVSYQRHGMGQFSFVRDLIQSGRYGRVLGLNSHLCQQWLQFTQGTWRHDPELSGGGQINDSGSHMIDILLWATGLRARRVSAMMDNRGTKVDIESIVSIEFEDRAYGSLTIIGDACLWHERHHVWLEKAALIIEGEDVLLIDEDGRHHRVSHWPSAVSPDRNFVDAILKGGEVLAPFECGLRTMELTEAAWRSAALGGQPVEIGDAP